MVETKGEYYHEIQACISCLGFMENGEYKKEPDVEGENYLTFVQNLLQIMIMT